MRFSSRFRPDRRRQYRDDDIVEARRTKAAEKIACIFEMSFKTGSKMKSSKWEVYIIQARSGKLYTGITNDLERRFEDHRNRRKGARFFHFSSPERIVFREGHANRSQALKREIAIKKMTRKAKLELIALASRTR